MNALSFLSALPKALGALWRAYKWAKAKDEAGVAFLSPAFFAEARKAVEEVVLGMTKGQDKGLRKCFATDNAMLRGIGIFMKSDTIMAVYHADGLLARYKAEDSLRAKDPIKSVTHFERPAGFVHPDLEEKLRA